MYLVDLKSAANSAVVRFILVGVEANRNFFETLARISGVQVVIPKHSITRAEMVEIEHEIMDKNWPIKLNNRRGIKHSLTNRVDEVGY